MRVTTGQTIHRLLFDCGEGVLERLGRAEVQALDHLMFSHLHMDHIGGFDRFFRTNFARVSKPNHLWGPPGSARILHHRFQGYLWNLHAGQSGTWYLHDLYPDRVETVRLEAGEAFAVAHPEPVVPRSGPFLETADYTVDALELDHRTVSLGYVVRERARPRVDPAALAGLGLPPGPWLRELIGGPPEGDLEVNGQRLDRRSLRAALLRPIPGEAAAYLTDFLLDPATLERLRPFLRGVTTLVCESQYRAADLELARRNHHLTSRQAAEIALAAGVAELVLFHVSDRYGGAECSEMLREARSVFAHARFPEAWPLV
nr:MBL fold metallo-hydrolase [Deinobacterium chartae]